MTGKRHASSAQRKDHGMPADKRTNAHPSPQDPSAALEIDAIISMAGDWRGET